MQDFHLHYRYSCRHSHLYSLHHSLRYGFNAEYNALLPLNQLARVKSVASVSNLFPIIYGAALLD